MLLYQLHTAIKFDMQELLYKHGKQLILSYHTNEQHINLICIFCCPSAQICDMNVPKNHLIETAHYIVLNENQEIDLLSFNRI